jgi:hypothetical protein
MRIGGVQWHEPNGIEYGKGSDLEPHSQQTEETERIQSTFIEQFVVTNVVQVPNPRDKPKLILRQMRQVLTV